MQVVIFISDVDGNMGSPPRLLILPADLGDTVPPNLRSYEWTYLARTTTKDERIGPHAAEVEASIARDGYAILLPIDLD